jgi:hypothetical protein
MSKRYRLAFIALIVVAASALAFGADAKGWYDACCYSPTFDLKFPGQTLDVTLQLDFGMLQLNSYLVGPEWWTAQARRCSTPGKCEEATSAKLQFQKIGKRRHRGGRLGESPASSSAISSFAGEGACATLLIP